MTFFKYMNKTEEDNRPTTPENIYAKEQAYQLRRIADALEELVKK